MKSSVREAREAADRLLRSDLIDDPVVRSEGKLGDPLPVRARADGSLAGWFVPVVAGDRLCGFFQFDAALTLLRYSRFPHRSAILDDLPAVRSWLDAATVRATAETRFPDLAPAGTPYLTHDGPVTRLAWAVPARGHTIMVAGSEAYLARDQGDVTG